jgi:hypothetical protein
MSDKKFINRYLVKKADHRSLAVQRQKYHLIDQDCAEEAQKTQLILKMSFCCDYFHLVSGFEEKNSSALNTISLSLMLSL